jgi:1,4-alpha-glucan branching enzyme
MGDRECFSDADRTQVPIPKVGCRSCSCGCCDQGCHHRSGKPRGNNNDSQYFSDKEPDGAGGLCLAFEKPEVRQFLINNATFLFEEFRIDGMRHDHVRIIVSKFASGWKFCQDLNSTCKFLRPDALQHAELWPPELAAVRPVWEGGAGFDTCLFDLLRNALYQALGQASAGATAHVDLTSIFHELWPRAFPESWRGVQNFETHDEVYHAKGKDRIARRADPSNAHSWYARSRARVINGLLLTVPGTPMMFMGQEFLEDKRWDDNLDNSPNLRLHWDGLTEDAPFMRDHLRFTRELVWLRRRIPGLTGEGFRPFHVHDDNRILAFHRWVPGMGSDVIIVASLAETTYDNYRIGFPYPGRWAEVFNSDVYDFWVNPQCRGNGGSVTADGPPWQEFAHSASVVIPANSLLVFAREI